MTALRLLVVDGNERDARDRHQADFGLAPGAAYAATLAGLAPEAVCDICFPADAGANLPDAGGIEGYDGVALTGSKLHLWAREPATLRQIEFARAVFAARVPFFGSCWGVQIAAVAAGGDVQKNPRGRETGFARNIAPSEAGLRHPLLASRARAYDAPAIHLDIVTAPPGDTTILAANGLAAVQAAEIRHQGGVFWGVQYHPEFSLKEMAAILRRLVPQMIAEGFVGDEADGERYCSDLAALHDDRSRTDIAWRLGLTPDVTEDARRLTELRNWLEFQVRPEKSRRGRA